MPTLLAWIGRHEEFRCLAEGVERTREVTGERVLLWPVASIEDLTKAAASRSPFTIVLDPLACEVLGPEGSAGPVGTLATIRQVLPGHRLTLVAYDDALNTYTRSQLERLGVRECLLRPGEACSATCAVHLTWLLASPGERRLLGTLPDATPAELWLAAARVARCAGLGIEVSDLVKGIVSHPAFRRNGFRGSPIVWLDTWCRWARIHAVFVELEERDESRDLVAQRFRFLGIPELDQFCTAVTGEDAASLLERGGAARLRGLAREWLRSDDGASPPETEEHGSEEDKKRLTQLYQNFWHDAYAGARRRGATHEEAEDAASRVFAKLYAADPEVWGREYSGAYFFCAGERQAIDMRRRVENRDRVDADNWLEEIPDPTLPEPGPALTKAEVVRNAIRATSEPQRSVARLCLLERWTGERTAEVLGLGLRTIERHRAAVKRNLKHVLQNVKAARRNCSDSVGG